MRLSSLMLLGVLAASITAITEGAFNASNANSARSCTSRMKCRCLFTCLHQVHRGDPPILVRVRRRDVPLQGYGVIWEERHTPVGQGMDAYHARTVCVGFTVIPSRTFCRPSGRGILQTGATRVAPRYVNTVLPRLVRIAWPNAWPFCRILLASTSHQRMAAGAQQQHRS